MKKEVVLLFAIFAVVFGAIPGENRFDPSWLVYKPHSSSEKPETTVKNVIDSKPIDNGNEIAKEEDSIHSNTV